MSELVSVVYQENGIGLQYPDGSIEVLFMRKRSIHDGIIHNPNQYETRYASVEDFKTFGVHYSKNYPIHDSVKVERLTCKSPNCRSKFDNEATYHFQRNPQPNDKPNRCFDCFFYG